MLFRAVVNDANTHLFIGRDREVCDAHWVKLRAQAHFRIQPEIVYRLSQLLFFGHDYHPQSQYARWLQRHECM